MEVSFVFLPILPNGLRMDYRGALDRDGYVVVSVSLGQLKISLGANLVFWHAISGTP